MGFPWVFHGFPWFFHGFSMVFHGFLCVFHGFCSSIHGGLVKNFDFFGVLLGLGAAQWIFTRRLRRLELGWGSDSLHESLATSQLSGQRCGGQYIIHFKLSINGGFSIINHRIFWFINHLILWFLLIFHHKSSINGGYPGTPPFMETSKWGYKYSLPSGKLT